MERFVYKRFQVQSLMCLENSFHSFSTATVKVDSENGSKLNPTALMGKL